jgi:hypothetical protein
MSMRAAAWMEELGKTVGVEWRKLGGCLAQTLSFSLWRSY